MLGSIISLFLVALAGASPLVERQASLGGPPSVDPFYQPNAGWQSQKPGTILKSRVTPGNITGASYQSSYQLLYRTTDSLGNPTHAVTTIIIPNNADYSKVVSYQIFYDSVDVDCSPSYQLTSGFNIDTGYTYALNAGYIVNTPDYEGPSASFTAGVISGQATLDSIRAALASTSLTGVSPSANVVMWGYSGGALASEWAAELQSKYASELKISGVALGGLTPNIRTVALTINAGPFAGFLPAGIIGLSTQFQNLSTYVDQQIKPQYKAQFQSARQQCLVGQIAANAYTNYSAETYLGFPAALDQPVPASVLKADGIMGLHGTPKGPLYVYKGVNDEISPVADTDALVKQYCGAGVNIYYSRDVGADHLAEMYTGEAGAFAFVQTILSGGSQISNCGAVIFT